MSRGRIGMIRPMPRTSSISVTKMKATAGFLPGIAHAFTTSARGSQERIENLFAFKKKKAGGEFPRALDNESYCSSTRKNCVVPVAVVVYEPFAAPVTVVQTAFGTNAVVDSKIAALS